MVQSMTEIFQGEVSPYGKKYWNKGAFMTGLNTMIVADEQRLEEIADPVIRRDGRGAEGGQRAHHGQRLHRPDDAAGLPV